MKLARSIVVLPLVLAAWALTSRPQSTNLPSTLARSEGLISGRVLLNGKGLPDVVVKAWLQPRANAPVDGALICRTNVEGYYRFSSVPTANYYVAAYSPGLVPLQRSGAESPRAVSVSPGEKIEGVNFQLIVGGVISGRVTDSEGKPWSKRA